jgi:hypothetical protein
MSFTKLESLLQLNQMVMTAASKALNYEVLYLKSCESTKQILGLPNKSPIQHTGTLGLIDTGYKVNWKAQLEIYNAYM